MLEADKSQNWRLSNVLVWTQVLKNVAIDPTQFVTDYRYYYPLLGEILPNFPEFDMLDVCPILIGDNFLVAKLLILACPHIRLISKIDWDLNMNKF